MQLVAFLRALLDVPVLLTWVDSEEWGTVWYVCPNHLTATCLPARETTYTNTGYAVTTIL